MSKIDFSKVIFGDPITTIVRVKPASNYQRENIKVIGQNVTLIDQNNRLIEEFEADSVFGVSLDPFIKYYTIHQLKARELDPIDL